MRTLARKENKGVEDVFALKKMMPPQGFAGTLQLPE